MGAGVLAGAVEVAGLQASGGGGLVVEDGVVADVDHLVRVTAQLAAQEAGE